MMVGNLGCHVLLVKLLSVAVVVTYTSAQELGDADYQFSCFEAVCGLESKCCAETWDETCINLAMQVPSDGEVETLSTDAVNTTSCFLNRRPIGGCQDPPGCSAVVCEIKSECCETGAELGELGWSGECVDLAMEHCSEMEPNLDTVLDPEFPVIYRKDANAVCPKGYVCDEERFTRCSDIQEAARTKHLIGDVYAGIQCPFGHPTIENCEIGNYCPSPTEMYKCPAGYYCPHKSQNYTAIPCTECGEGSEAMVREKYGYYVIAFVVVLLFFVKKAYDKVQFLREQRNSSNTLLKRQGELERILPKLREIAIRLEQLHPAKGSTVANPNEDESGGNVYPTATKNTKNTNIVDDDTTSNSKPSSSKSPSIKFNAGILFDRMNVDARGELEYTYLNTVLDLDTIEITEFARRMNERGHADTGTTTVTRQVFIKHVCQVLEEVTRLTVSPKDAAALFEKLASIHGTNKYGEISPDCLHSSSLCDFLSDVQILYIAKSFREMAPHSRRRREHELLQQESPRVRGGFFTRSQPEQTISKEVFVEHYPRLMLEATIENREEQDVDDDGKNNSLKTRGVDINFEDLSLFVKSGNQSKVVLDHVTGRVEARGMCALMGASGAGKTSLLNVLCGRAYYGESSGKIFVNGHLTSIEEHRDAVGFVPQDDIVYAELTVRENFVYSGKFRLPKGTSMREIEDLAHETMANLGLSRVANSLVGNVRRRGVSGGERKRVNIGLELMAKPSAIFLDEPTSGLDASSALLVMKSLRHLVDVQGVTICSAIHQPRMFIYELFDSLVLLGVGGRMVYHGKTSEAQKYFEGLNFSLPSGESVADWLLDISTGRVEPDVVAPSRRASRFQQHSLASGVWSGMSGTFNADASIGDSAPEDDEFTLSSTPSPSQGSGRDYIVTEDFLENNTSGSISQGSNRARIQSTEMTLVSVEEEKSLDVDESTVGSNAGRKDVSLIKVYNQADTTTNDDNSCATDDASEAEVFPLTDSDIVSAKGVSSGKADLAFEESKARREWLYQQWNSHARKVIKKGDAFVPEVYPLPSQVEKPSFQQQLRHQIGRSVLVIWRNGFAKVIETVVIVGTVAMISAFDGTVAVTTYLQPILSFDQLVRPEPDGFYDIMEQVFYFSLTRWLLEYALKVSVLTTVLVGLAAAKSIADKKMEFFREAASGYDVNAYYIAVNIVSTIEHSAQIVIAAFFAYWLRNSFATPLAFFVNFLVLTWLCVSWALLWSVVIPPDNVPLVTAAFMCFSGLLFSGGLIPVEYYDMYRNGGFMELFSGLISPTRYFNEAVIITERRCLGPQYGMTVADEAVNFDLNWSGMALLGYGINDLENVTTQSHDGWYATVLPAVFAGFFVRMLGAGAIHLAGRHKQIKKPLWHEIRKSKRVGLIVLLYIEIMAILFGVTSWLILRTNSGTVELPELDAPVGVY